MHGELMEAVARLLADERPLAPDEMFAIMKFNAMLRGTPPPWICRVRVPWWRWLLRRPE